MHLSREVYENPKQWDPDRFSREEMAKRHVSSFAAFSIGPRSCIGEYHTEIPIGTEVIRNEPYFKVKLL